MSDMDIRDPFNGTVTIPGTGELFRVDDAQPEEIVDRLASLDDLKDDIRQAETALRNELARRVDETGGRTATLGRVKLQVNAPTEEIYTVDGLLAELEPLVAAGEVTKAVLDSIVVTTPETTQVIPASRKVAKNAINAHKKGTDRNLLAALQRARTVRETTRTVKVVARITKS